MKLFILGGTGNSGVGRELSQWFLERFTEQKLLVFDLGDTEVRYNRRAEGGCGSREKVPSGDFMASVGTRRVGHDLVLSKNPPRARWP